MHSYDAQPTHMVQMRNRIRLQLFLAPESFETDGQESELFPPIPEIVDPDDFPPVGFVQVGQEGADDGRSEVAGVERLGDVGRGEFDCKAGRVERSEASSSDMASDTSDRTGQGKRRLTDGLLASSDLVTPIPGLLSGLVQRLGGCS